MMKQLIARTTHKDPDEDTFEEVNNDGVLCYIEGMNAEINRNVSNANYWYEQGMKVNNRKCKRAYYRLNPKEPLFRVQVLIR